ncbi:MAG: hypothetical protein OSJ73_16995 [Lachnospiraceae bacterium]|nr:hypothetical protein [Lachnospiraceae bacterium]
MKEKLVNIMGGSVIETESERLMCMGAAKMVVELGQENGLDDEVILWQMQEKIGLSLEKAKFYLAQYGKQPV